jgi:hypothetical protein
MYRTNLAGILVLMALISLSTFQLAGCPVLDTDPPLSPGGDEQLDPPLDPRGDDQSIPTSPGDDPINIDSLIDIDIDHPYITFSFPMEDERGICVTDTEYSGNRPSWQRKVWTMPSGNTYSITYDIEYCRNGRIERIAGEATASYNGEEYSGRIGAYGGCLSFY